MITFSELGKYGRLGNQLFQIASTIGIAKENSVDFLFPNWVCSYTNKVYSDFFEKKLPIGTIPYTENITEKYFHYSPIDILHKKKDFNLFGYFQSEKYFQKYREDVLEYFQPKEYIRTFIDKKFEKKLTNSCSLHIRRGDYLNLQHIHPVLPLDYYYDAISILYSKGIENVNFLIFSDDIDWCEKNIKLPNTTFVMNENEIYDLYLMSICKNNIIANSSFSWWGAWLNRYVDKKVVCPNNWFSKNSVNNTNDLYCHNWIKL